MFHGEHGVIFIARTINELRLDGDCETIIIKAHLSIPLGCCDHQAEETCSSLKFIHDMLGS